MEDMETLQPALQSTAVPGADNLIVIDLQDYFFTIS